MRIKTLPLPAAPHPSSLLPCHLRIQPLLLFPRSPRIPAPFQELARSGDPLRRHLRALQPLPLPKLARLGELARPDALLRSFLPRLRLLPQRLPLSQPLPLARRYSRPLRPSPPLRHRLRRSGSPPDKSCPPSSRRCPGSPSIAPASSPRASPHW